jgi:hypothetical protein
MDAEQWSALCEIAHGEHKRGFDSAGTVQDIALEADGLKRSPPGRHPRGGHSPNTGSYRLMRITFHTQSFTPASGFLKFPDWVNSG